MKKRILCGIAAFVVFFCLSGCFSAEEKYDTEAADQIAAKGAALMETWLEENMPDAELEACTAFLQERHYGRETYLTDYACGQIRRGEETTAFAVHTLTGAVYFEMAADRQQELNTLAEEWFCEAIGTLGIVPQSRAEGTAFRSYVMAPVRDGGSTAEIPEVYAFDFGLPAGVEDLRGFVRDPQNRAPICIHVPTMMVADTVDLSALDLAAIERLEAEYGLRIEALHITNVNQTFQKSFDAARADAELWTFGNWLEADGIELWGMAYKRTERRDMETGELIVSDLQVDPEKDLTFEKTDFGYRLSLHNKDLYDRLMLRAHEGAEILAHTYYCLDEADYDPDQDLSETADRTFWQDWGGTFVLTDSADTSARWLYDGDLLVRME